MSISATEPAVFTSRPALPMITDAWVRQDYINNIFSLPENEVFGFDKTTTYETVAARLERYKPNTVVTFVVYYSQPGSLLYSLYGPDYFIIVTKVLAP